MLTELHKQLGIKPAFDEKRSRSEETSESTDNSSG